MPKLASSTTDTVLIYFHFIYVWVFCPQRPKEGVGSPGAGIEGSEQLNKGRSPTLALGKNNKLTPSHLSSSQSLALFIGLWCHLVIKIVKTSESLGWQKGVKYKILMEAINVHIYFLKIHVFYHIPWPWSPPQLLGLEEELPHWRFHSEQLCAKGWSHSREREK